ncbi:hypothetical protein SEA_ZETA1847_29 [Microbacterium phage Zeta1847]|uniref:Uncharacterized protein n=1 Tax=Microbacterium phage Zeta1847 TaxID=2201444 RepID=A0A2Z4QAN2_9CAUD|nr:hypothetical protein HOT46_gp29 [Microbacterium phage Zeta1847]AWY06663.1 hypothetical protein SEA_ZETA1847_29 [Microbacterium phage Zeta1847]
MARAVRFTKRVYTRALEANRDARHAILRSAVTHRYFETGNHADIVELRRLGKLRFAIIARHRREQGGDPRGL